MTNSGPGGSASSTASSTGGRSRSPFPSSRLTASQHHHHVQPPSHHHHFGAPYRVGSGTGVGRNLTQQYNAHTRPILEGLSSYHAEDISTSSVTSPFLQGLLRFSPPATSSLWSPTANTSATLTAGLAASSAASNGYRAGGPRVRTRFFESLPASSTTTPREGLHPSMPTTNTTTTAPITSTSALGSGNSFNTFVTTAGSSKTTLPAVNRNSSPSEFITSKSVSCSTSLDGIPIDNLRQLAKKSLLQLPTEQASFYASLVYAKTAHPDDAVLLAQAHLHSQKYTACLRVLEEAQLILQPECSTPQSWDALLLACTALAATDEWTSLVELLEDSCRVPSNINKGSQFGRLTPGLPLEDDDNFGWQTLQQHIRSLCSSNESGDTSIADLDPLARLCWWRAQAYHETGHTVRAARYWKRALLIDPFCQPAWEALLKKHLLTPSQAHELCQDLPFGPDDEWLRSLYLARIEITPLETSTPTNNSNKDFTNAGVNNTNNSLMHWQGPQLDASSIQMSLLSSPDFFSRIPNSTTNSVMAAGSNGEHETHIGTSAAKSNVPIQADIDHAFDQLWKVHKLENTPHFLALAARRAYRRYEWKEALNYCQQLDQIDPAMTDASYCYVATLLLLGHKRQLFRIAHEWVESNPKSAPAWFAVGAYYYCCERYHVAQRHFCRATRLDPQCTEAWIAFGCSFAACDESDQALASFRAAQRLSPGEHSSLLYMGMEYVRTNHLVLAQYFLQSAMNASGGDPLCLHELGVLALQKGELQAAINYLHRALDALYGAKRATIRRQKQKGNEDNANFKDNDEVDEFNDVEKDTLESLCQDPYWEPTLFNLGHAYRKSRRFEEAARCFLRCKALCPDKFSTYSACGFTKHLMGDLDGAIEDYHQALSCKRDDPFSTEMLNRALKEATSSTSGFWKKTAFAADDNRLNTENKAFHNQAPITTTIFPVGLPMSRKSSSVSHEFSYATTNQFLLSPPAAATSSVAASNNQDDSLISEDMDECSDVDMSAA